MRIRGTSRTLPAIAVLILGLTPVLAHAFAAGAPICEVNTLPLVEMSPTLADPAPTGWSVQANRSVYVPGQAMQLRIRNSNPAKAARGILMWSKSGPSAGAGQFLLQTKSLFQLIPAPAACGEWAISHNSSTVKTQPQLTFDWMPPAQGTVIVRAFVIEDCGLAQGGCRAHQALTPVLVLQPALFVDGFED